VSLGKTLNAVPTLGPSSLLVVVSHFERHLMLFPTLWPSLTNDMQTEQLLCWSGMTDTEHSRTSSSNEEEAKFRLLPNESEDFEMEWSLFRSMVIASAVNCYCGQKWLRVVGLVRKEPPVGTRMLNKLFKQRKIHLRTCSRTGWHLSCNPGILRRENLQRWQ